MATVLALFFVMYALADISFLQVYCGNESIGIPPQHHIADRNDDISTKKNNRDRASVIAKDHHDRSGTDRNYDHRHDCFSWHQTIVSAFILTTRNAVEDSTSRLPQHFPSGYKNSNPDPNLRPPQTV